MYIERDTKLASFPMHVPCLNLLRKRICGSEDHRKLELDILHDAMSRLATKHGLVIDYWKPKAAERFVSCDAGQEYLSIAPEISPEFETEIRQTIASGKVNQDNSLAAQPKYWTKSNPFNKMPREIILSIAKYLETWERRALSEAVWPACESGNLTNLFWKSTMEEGMKFAQPFLTKSAEEGSKTQP